MRDQSAFPTYMSLSWLILGLVSHTHNCIESGDLIVLHVKTFVCPVVESSSKVRHPERHVWKLKKMSEYSDRNVHISEKVYPWEDLNAMHCLESRYRYSASNYLDVIHYFKLSSGIWSLFSLAIYGKIGNHEKMLQNWLEFGRKTHYVKCLLNFVRLINSLNSQA